MLSLEKHGDILEREYYTEIISYFPQYEELWKIFIGNNGSAEIIKTGKQDIDTIRDEIAQNSYTIFESCVSLYRMLNINFTISNLKDYIDANDTFLLMQIHIGRIRDCIQRIGEILRIENLESDFYEAYKRRSIIVHGKKIPYTIIENILTLPKVGENKGEWHNRLLWKDITKDNLEFMRV